MNSLRASDWPKKAIVAFMLLGLLWQVQTVFACQMMDHSAPTRHCCCGEMSWLKQAGEDLSDHAPCCDISTELALKASDLESDDPLVLQSRPAFELPHLNQVFPVISLWPDTVVPPPSMEIWDVNADPGNPGTHTYLSTLRLRI